MQATVQAICVSEPVRDGLEGWMERYQEGNAAAAGLLVRALSPSLLGFFRHQAATREQAEDLLQETWLRIHKSRQSYRPGEPLLPWVYAIARRVRVDYFRRNRRIHSHETPMDILPENGGWPGPPRELPAFERLVESLPESQREVLTLMKVSGLSVDEIARATASTAGAVKQKAHRAYRRLRDLLQRDETSNPSRLERTT